ncbi:MAG: electron transfer flavoprotein subunit alpha/FixB family protein [Candidatus Neomarinimicrobiota bacterium]
MDILVVLEESKSKIHRASLEAIVAAQKIAEDLSLNIAALVIGSDIANLSTQAANLGISEVVTVNHEMLSKYNADTFAETLIQVIEIEGPSYIFCGHTYQVRDYLPKVSALTQKPLITDVVGYRVEDNQLIFSKQVFNGKLSADIITKTDPPILISFQAAAFSADDLGTGNSSVRPCNITLDQKLVKTESEEPFQETAGDVDLSAANIIVSVGRGIGKKENMAIVEDLASALNGEIGSSRPIVDAGWLPNSRQVGSSGQSVTPTLYLALGISGAIQHIVGMKGSKNIVAINKDPDAPIFEVADYGIVGDIIDIIPKLTEAIKES